MPAPIRTPSSSTRLLGLEMQEALTLPRVKKTVTVPPPAHWHISALGFWEDRYGSSFIADHATVWWSGFDWEEGKRIEQASQVLTAIKVSSGDVYPDFLKLTNLTLASERFRALVEALEPGTHQFFPVKMVRKSRELISLPYFLLNVARSLDCIVAEKSDLAWKATGSPASGVQAGPVGYQVINSHDGLVLRKDVVRGRHMFRSQGKLPLKGCLFFSNELMTKVTEAGVKGVWNHPTREE